MNTILQKRIEEAAKEYSFNIPSELFHSLQTQHERKLWKDEIEQAYIYGGEDALQNQWISVEEELPKYEERVLVAHQYGCQVASFYKDNSHQYWGVAKESPIGADVTHWAEIPSLKGGEK